MHSKTNIICHGQCICQHYEVYLLLTLPVFVCYGSADCIKLTGAVLES